MIRTVGTNPELLNTYKAPQKVVFTVLTASVTVYVATSFAILKQPVGGQLQGTPVTSAAQVAIDVVGDLYWVGSVAGILVDVLETGAI